MFYSGRTEGVHAASLDRTTICFAAQSMHKSTAKAPCLASRSHHSFETMVDASVEGGFTLYWMFSFNWVRARPPGAVS